MKNEHAELLRIALRYGATVLVTKGVVSAEYAALATDPALIEIVVGLVTVLGTELWFVRGKRA